MNNQIPRILSIAGTDPTGGAGLHADLKSISAAGGFAMGAVTAIVAQNTNGVTSIEMPSDDIVTAQLNAVSDDVEIDGVKIGMLGTTDVISTVRAWLEQHNAPVVVLDPVMVATSGDRLLVPKAEAALLDMLHLADYITPNIPELEVIAGVAQGSIDSPEAAQSAAQRVAQRFHVRVVMKGGHLSDEVLSNAIVDENGVIAQVTCPRVHTSSTHGTGCSMSSALATRLAAGESAQDALSWVTSWLYESISHGEALHVGYGHGPVDHMHRLRRLASAASNRPWPSYRLSAEELLSGEGDAADSPARTNASTSTSSPQIGRPTKLTRDWNTDPLVPAAGPWTQRLWNASRPIVLGTQSLPFIQGLADGTLQTDHFTAYQFQDFLYLNQYARALACLGSRAVDDRERAHWTTSAAGISQEEQSLHRDWLSHHDTSNIETATSPITAGYTDFLLARTCGEDYLVGAAAVLPCFWLYAHIGLQLVAYNREDHPFHRWLSTYGDAAFTQSTARAIAIVEHHMETASPELREQAARAFMTACQWELEFFDQTDRD